jgi:hypothetical protein
MTTFAKFWQLIRGRSAASEPQSQFNPPPASPANAMSGGEIQSVLQRYGVAGLLTPQDDPVFWATVLLHFWPEKELAEKVARPVPPVFRFGIKECSAENTLEWGQAQQTASLNLTCWPDGQLRRQDSEPADDPKRPSCSLTISRPSVGVRSAWFESRGQFGLTHGRGLTGVCRRNSAGIWSEPIGLESFVS